MKYRYIPACDFDSLPKCLLAEGIHHVSDIDAIGTPRGAGLAGSTYPDCIAVEYMIFYSKLDLSKQFMGNNIHRERKRTTVSTFLALKTGGNILSAELFNLLTEGPIWGNQPK